MILYRHVIREHILPFCYSLAVIIFLFVMQLAVDLIHKILSKGLDPQTVGEIFFLNLAWMIALAVPMAILIATLTAFGKMSADSEILAIKASGRNVYYLMAPVLVGAVLIAVLLVYFNNLILPEANHKSTNLMSDISRKKPAALIEPKVLIRDFKNYAIWVEKVNSRTGKLSNVRIFTDIPGKDPSTTVAIDGEIHATKDKKYLKLILYDGETHSVSMQEGHGGYFIGEFDKQTIYIENIDSELRRTESNYRGDREKSAQMMLKDVADFKKQRDGHIKEHAQSLSNFIGSIRLLDSLSSTVDTTEEKADTIPTFAAWLSNLEEQKRHAQISMGTEKRSLDRLVRRVHQQDKRISQYLVEIHKKFSIPFTCIVFVLIGAPLGIMAKRGGIIVGASYSVFFFVVFWAFLIGGESLADRLIVDPALAMWTGNAIIGVAGLFLTMRMMRETTFISFSPLIRLWLTLAKSPPVKLAAWIIGTIVRIAFGIPSWIINKLAGLLPAYLIKIFLGWVAGVFIALTIVFVVVDYVSNLKLFEAAVFMDVVYYYYYYLPWFIQLLSPIGILLATMFAMGLLSKNSEITAMKASGISIRRLTLPLLVVGLGLFAAAFYYGEEVVPRANSRREEIRDDLENKRSTRSGRSPRGQRSFHRNFYYFGRNNVVYCFQEFRTHPQRSKNVWRETFSGATIAHRIQAEKLLYRDDTWFFVDGHQRTIHSSDSTSMAPFDTLYDSVLTATPEEMVTRIKGVEEMSYWELQGAIDKAHKRGEKATKYQADLHFKIALPFMNFIVILLGIAVTARAGRKGAGAVFGVGLLIVFAYWILAQFGLALGQDERINPMLAAWAGNAIFFVMGAVLYVRASR